MDSRFSPEQYGTMSEFNGMLESLRADMLARIEDLKAQYVSLRPDDDIGKALPEYSPFNPTPDANTSAPNYDPVRKTIEYNPATGVHEWELQLRNVGNTNIFPVSQRRLPIFTKDANNAGDLTWILERDIQNQLPWTNFFSISGADVTFTAGTVSWGTKIQTVSNTGPHAVTDGQYWGIRVTFSGGSGGFTAAWISSSTENTFTDTETTISKWYYKFGVAGGAAFIDSVAATGNWKIPSVFAPE